MARRMGAVPVRAQPARPSCRLAEETKQRVRGVRQKAVDKLKKMEHVSTDETFRLIKVVQEVTNDVSKEVVDAAEARKRQIME